MDDVPMISSGNAGMSMLSMSGSFRYWKHEIANVVRDFIALMRFDRRGSRFGTPRRRTGSRKRILILDELLPEAKFGAGFPRAAELLQAIIEAGWEASVYPMRVRTQDYVAVQKRFPQGVRFLRGYRDHGLRRVIRDSLGKFDAVLISRPSVMKDVERICRSVPTFMASAHCIYDAEAALSMREKKRRALFGPSMSDGEYEAALAAEVAVPGVRTIVSVNEAEAAIFRARTSAKVMVISHTCSVSRDPPGFGDRADFFFVGKSMGYRDVTPNVDSLIWFVEEIMPLLDRLITPDYRLVIAGMVDDSLVAKLSSQRVIFEGVVDDLAPFYDRSRVFIAPTRYAAGVPLKVVEAAAAGIPSVVTSILAEQLGMIGGVECMAATSAEAFASCCATLYTEPVPWLSIRNAAMTRIAEDYSRDTFATAVRTLLAHSHG